MKSMHALYYVLVALIIGSVLMACSRSTPTAAPTLVKELPSTKTIVPTQAPAATPTKAPEPTEAPATTPVGLKEGVVPYPDPPMLGVGGELVKRQAINEIIVYKALSEYKEPSWVAALVKAGKLPPVKDRLPKEPQVVLKSGMSDGIGVYGDVGRFFSASPTAGWNFMAGTSAGGFGIESYSYNYQGLVKIGPLWRSVTDVEPFPNLAQNWEWSADGKQLTMHLIEGARWSDGQPFTADDVIFTWEDYLSDPGVNSWRKADAFAFGGQAARLEKVDDYTVRWTFGAVKPAQALYLMSERNFDVFPAHIFRPLHPRYNKSTDYKAFANTPAPQDLPQVTMGPWVAVEYKPDELLLMRRNPYFWKVDETGQQLPYFDELQFQKGPSSAGRSLCVMAGGCDLDSLETPSGVVQALKRTAEANAQSRLAWGPETLGYWMQLNLSADLGVKTIRDGEVRKLLRDLRFRRAVSHAINRDGVVQSILNGPFLRAWAGGLYPGAPEFDKSSVVYYSYNPDLARRILAELGFRDTDNNGILNWTSGPLSGQELAIGMYANQDQQEAVAAAEALVSQLGKVGIKVSFRSVTSAVGDDIIQSGEWDTYVARGGVAYALPHTGCTEIAPVAKAAPSWHREGDTPRQLQSFEEQLVKIIDEYCSVTDGLRRQALMKQYNTIFTENLYNIGVFVGRSGVNLAKRFKNTNPGLPTYLYSSTEDGIMLEQVWTPTDQQAKQVRPNTIPEYKR